MIKKNQKSLDKVKGIKLYKRRYSVSVDTGWFKKPVITITDCGPVSLDEFIARDGFRKADKKKPKTNNSGLINNQPTNTGLIDEEFDKIKKEILKQYDIWFTPPCRKDMLANRIINFVIKPLLTQQRTELLEEILNQVRFIIDSNYNPETKTIDYDEVQNQITNLNKKDEK